MNRFARTRRLFGDAALDRLRRTRIAVVGLGAVGSYVVEALARSAVGFLRLADFDRVRETNFNRQLYALESTLGQYKTDVAAARVRQINPACEVEALRLFVDREAAEQVLRPPLDVVIDAMDSLNPKVEFLAEAVRRCPPGTLILSSMGAACRTDPAAVRVGDIGKTRECPLAKFVRKKLRARDVTSGIRCVYSVEPVPPAPPDTPDAPPEPLEEELRRGRQRRPLGSFSCLPGIFGLILAREAIVHVVGASPVAPAGAPPPRPRPAHE
jgi:tRNA A37 threonylcarbamoyladenosine dehydratase